MVEVTAVTTEQFSAFLDRYGFATTDETHPLPLAYMFMKTLPFCDNAVVDDETMVEAQCFIAYSISITGGGFNPAAIAEAKTLTKSGLGRSAIVDEWKVNEALIGTDPVSLLKSLPLAYGLLKSYICDHGDSSITAHGGIAIAVV